MTNDQRSARLMKIRLHEVRTGSVEPRFLYFTDPAKPAGKAFLGACIVEAHGFLTAVDRAYALGINPGGAVLLYDTPAHDPSMRDHLITDDDEMELLGFRRKASSRKRRTRRVRR